jgi:tRNA pseudouridine38-40 synthase
VPGEKDERPSTVRTVYTTRLVPLLPELPPWQWNAPAQAGIVEREGWMLAVDLVANAFLPQMIRTIVGTLLEVGYGKLPADEVGKIIESRDRARAGPTAKPQGLCLLWVEY